MKQNKWQKLEADFWLGHNHDEMVYSSDYSLTRMGDGKIHAAPLGMIIVGGIGIDHIDVKMSLSSGYVLPSAKLAYKVIRKIDLSQDITKTVNALMGTEFERVTISDFLLKMAARWHMTPEQVSKSLLAIGEKKKD